MIIVARFLQLKNGRAYFECDGRCFSLPLSAEQERELRGSVGKSVKVTVEQDAPGPAEVGL